MRPQPFTLLEDQTWKAPFVIPEEASMVLAPDLPHWVLPKAAFLLQEKLRGMGYAERHLGKMFGVLVVRFPQGGLGYLSAFSGTWDHQFPMDGFVPPVFNWMQPSGFFRTTEALVNQLTKQIVGLEQDGHLQALKQRKAALRLEAQQDLAIAKELVKRAREIRHQERAQIKHADEAQFARWERQSQTEKADYRRRRLAWDAKLASMDAEIAEASTHLEELQDQRKRTTTALQTKLFHAVRLTNGLGIQRSVLDLFSSQGLGWPPSGTGDCAAPKLLHYAYQYGYTPLGLTEFWWGASPHSALRRHGYFYPICKGKCEPLMSHLLQGFQRFRRPESQVRLETPEILCHTPDFLVVQKPSGWLSVPGKSSEPQLVDWLKSQNLRCDGFYPVHRLDRDTSGLWLVALHPEAYAALQKQFAQRTVEKEYLAWVKGKIAQSEGEINLPLIPDWSNRPRQMVCEKTGKPSLTKWKKIGEKEGKTLLKVNPITGRTHQIRVHLAHPRGLNVPILGDPLYGIPEGRLGLHAYLLAFDDPSHGTRQIFTWPMDFFTLDA